MEQLKELLDAGVNSVTFDLGRIDRVHGSVRTSYSSRPEEVITADDFRVLVGEHHSPQTGELGSASSARVLIPDELLTQLTDCIRTELEECIDPATDRIGHAFPIGSESSRVITVKGKGTTVFEGASTVETLARVLVRGATLLGANQVVQRLSGWMQGKPITYQARTVVNTNRVLTQPVSSVDGVRVESLPLSTDQLPNGLPGIHGLLPRDYIGRVVVTIDHSAAPVLFQPTNKRSVEASALADVPEFDPDLVSLALSVEADSHADVAFSWNDYEDLDVFRLAGLERTWSFGRSRWTRSRNAGSFATDFETGVTTLQVRDAASLQIDGPRFGDTLNALAEADSKIRVAAERWLRTKDTNSSLADRFVDLRVALESLYLRDIGDPRYRGEMRFRLALYGAWHLGTDLTERKDIRGMLRDAYDAASGAVHSGHMEFTAEKQELLADAQALCRRGILKMLRDGQPDWDNLIFGG